MTLFATPSLTPTQRKRLARLDKLRHKLGLQTRQSRGWIPRLRRLVEASAVENSTAIAGYRLPFEETVKLLTNEGLATADDASQQAVVCYGRAMDHVAAMAADKTFSWSDRVILDLHFDACYFQHDQNPGRWRTGPADVTGVNGQVIYQAPDAEQVAPLITELVEWLQYREPKTLTVVQAAMAHLNLVSIHPFQDGNGRVARILQSLVLAREGLLSPAFGSIEEYLGHHTATYYSVLQKTHGATYTPLRDASKWVDFCIEAHIAQAQQRLNQVAQAAKRWEHLESLVEQHGWPDRFVIALEQSLIGGANRIAYEREADVSSATASSDFRRLLDAGLVTQHGRGRQTRYIASKHLL